MSLDVAVIAGSVSSVVFAISVLPMLGKAIRTRDLSSYSLGNLSLANLGNLVHSIYIYSLPAGPIWALHGFYLVTTGLMFVLFVVHRTTDRTFAERPRAGLPEVRGRETLVE